VNEYGSAGVRFPGLHNPCSEVVGRYAITVNEAVAGCQISQISSPFLSMEIARPSIGLDHPDRHILCQDAIDAAFSDLLERAAAAGWSEREVVVAVIDLADNRMLSIAANDDTNVLIELLKRMT
jgi:hypothetical protein